MKAHFTPSLTPLSYAHNIFYEAYIGSGEHHRALHVAVRNILKLATGRGYPYAIQLTQLFGLPGVSLEMTTLFLKRLLAYVSVNEFVAMSEHAYRPMTNKSKLSHV